MYSNLLDQLYQKLKTRFSLSDKNQIGLVYIQVELVDYFCLIFDNWEL